MSSKSHCCVPGCNTALGRDWRLYHFPNPEKDSERFRTWVMKVGSDIAQLENSFIYKNRRVCGRHFENKWILARNNFPFAVPSLHLSGHYRTLTEHSIQENSVQVPQTSCNSNANTIIPEGHSRTLTERSIQEDSAQVPQTSCNSNSNAIISKGSKYYKTVSSTEVQLHKEVLKIKAVLTRTQNKKIEVVKRLRQANKLKKLEAYQKLTEHLEPAAKTFFAMQIHQCSKKPKGRRFTLDEKILALSLYKPSPKAYQILKKVCALPSRRTLDKILHKVTIKPGINEILFENLKTKVKSMKENHKYCAILFDEMAISPQLTYNVKEDAISGFCDDGTTKKLSYCDHVLVFMIRGVFKKYKQAIAYSFCAGTTSTASLTAQLKQIIIKVQEMGLKVVSTVCDQGSTNMATINNLIKQTRGEYLRDNKEWKEDFYEINGEKIFAIYDPPHLIKGIRNNLMTKGLEFIEGSKKKDS